MPTVEANLPSTGLGPAKVSSRSARRASTRRRTGARRRPGIGYVAAGALAVLLAAALIGVCFGYQPGTCDGRSCRQFQTIEIQPSVGDAKRPLAINRSRVALLDSPSGQTAEQCEQVAAMRIERAYGPNLR